MWRSGEANGGADIIGLPTMTPECTNRQEPDDRVTLYPTFGYPISGGTVWRILVQGQIGEGATTSFAQRLLLKGLIRALDLTPDIVSGELFGKRISGFLLNPISGERIQIELAGQRYVLRRKSKRSGLFSCKIDLPASQLAGYRTYGRFGTITGQRPVRESRWEANSCPILLAEQTGVSVISDIDDTIKLTEVTSRRQMLRRTFAMPFEGIDGMASLYQKWAADGALFHYVSSSPWQIFNPLCEFLNQFEFPLGSIHLKWFRLRDEILKRWRFRKKGKGGVIRNLIKRMPNRSFVLIGDSGERDPEIYSKIAARHPDQILRICIRQIEANPLDNDRLSTLQKRYKLPVPIQIFTDSSELGSLV
ncbi:MAG: phosphatidate phosphatase App1 family protein [Pirellula sp.]|jgi:phosphatidate phosphatase APP1